MQDDKAKKEKKDMDEQILTNPYIPTYCQQILVNNPGHPYIDIAMYITYICFYFCSYCGINNNNNNNNNEIEHPVIPIQALLSAYSAFM